MRERDPAGPRVRGLHASDSRKEEEEDGRVMIWECRFLALQQTLPVNLWPWGLEICPCDIAGLRRDGGQSSSVIVVKEVEAQVEDY